MYRRWSLGLALSLAMHGLLAGGLVGWSWLHGAAPSRIDIDVTGMRLEDLKDLPLGAPPAAATPAPAAAAARPRARLRAKGGDATRPREDRGKSRAGDGEDEGGGAGPTDLGQLGPEGSRFTMLLRLDRLKGTAYAEPVDALLMHMPNRRDLLEGTGLSFYDDFEALLVGDAEPARLHGDVPGGRATTWATGRCAGRQSRRARHGAGHTGWRSEGGRPWGERRARAGATPPTTRDARLIVLPAPGLVVVTPPAYRALLLAPARKARPEATDGGAPDGGSRRDGGDRGAVPELGHAPAAHRRRERSAAGERRRDGVGRRICSSDRRPAGRCSSWASRLELPARARARARRLPEPFPGGHGDLRRRGRGAALGDDLARPASTRCARTPTSSSAAWRRSWRA